MLSVDPRPAFAEAVYCATGAAIQPIADGQIHRFEDPQGKRGNAACWYVLYLDDHPAGAFGNWRTGFQSNWSQKGRTQGQQEQERLQAILKVARVRRERERVEAHAQAAVQATQLWEGAEPATVAHPYLARKSIPALGLRQHGAMLLVPMQTIGGELMNLQRICPAGDKRFLKGGRITDCFALVGQEIPETGNLYIAEGWATAMTIHVETRGPVVAAMNAGNLKPVALALQRARPGLDLILAADDDHRTPGNPGMRKATEAARAVSGGLIRPAVCGGENCTCVDFNDLVVCGRRAAR
ncbi:MAG: toprim domain-containing protein [Halieaceae bacterium]|nr:toprim domain-containing protein [Halieaceae bacterium]